MLYQPRQQLREQGRGACLHRIIVRDRLYLYFTLVTHCRSVYFIPPDSL